MSNWTDELKAKVIEMYKAGDPTPENSTELIKEIADEIGESPNGVRMVLVQAQVYVKKEAGAKAPDKAGAAPKRASKGDSIAALRTAIEAKGKPVDDDILDKLTGKAAVYFLSVIE